MGKLPWNTKCFNFRQSRRGLDYDKLVKMKIAFCFSSFAFCKSFEPDVNRFGPDLNELEPDLKASDNFGIVHVECEEYFRTGAEWILQGFGYFLTYLFFLVKVFNPYSSSSYP